MLKMRIKIKYTAQLKKEIGIAEETVETESKTTIENLVIQLNNKHKMAFQNIVFSVEGKFLDAVLLIVNGKQVRYNSGLVLNNGDNLTIMSPIAGG